MLLATTPPVADDGTLTFEPADPAGTTTVRVYLRDSGWTTDSGADTSAAQVFTVSIMSGVKTRLRSSSTRGGGASGLAHSRPEPGSCAGAERGLVMMVITVTTAVRHRTEFE